MEQKLSEDLDIAITTDDGERFIITSESSFDVEYEELLNAGTTPDVITVYRLANKGAPLMVKHHLPTYNNKE